MTEKTMNTEYKEEFSEKTAMAMEAVIQQDPGSRGLGKWAISGGLFSAAKSLSKGREILIATGFYTASAGVVETDGPPGTAVLAYALEQSGKKVRIITDDHAESVIKKALESIDSIAAVEGFPCGEIPDSDKILSNETTHFIALERPGKSSDGKYYNFRGTDISSYVAPFDETFIEASSKDIVTIGIGDGGNELGMGNVSPMIDEHIAPGRAFSCNVKSDICICAGVSNWAGYALAALLSGMEGINLMPHEDRFGLMISSIVKAGAVDGVTGLSCETVDGLDRKWERGVYREMYMAASDRNYIPRVM